MFCPQCRVEYRPGFTHCTDCDVDLVNDVSAGESQQVRRSEPPHLLSTQLWQGADPHFYLLLLASLGNKNVPCFGRPVNPPAYDSFEDQPLGFATSAEFEILVSKENLSFARWVLSSEQETLKEQDAVFEDSEGQEEETDTSPGVTGVCPLCFSHFTTFRSLCPNCGVPLRPPQGGSLKENPAKLLCNLPHPQFLADLRMALHRVGIPFNNANFPQGPDTLRGDVVVLDSDFERATEVLSQVLQYWEFDRSLNLGPSHDPRESFWPPRAKDNGWYPEDLETLLWSGTNLNVLEAIGMALREHEVAYRVDSPEPGSAKLFIHPEDEEPACEVLRDVIEAVSLE